MEHLDYSSKVLNEHGVRARCRGRRPPSRRCWQHLSLSLLPLSFSVYLLFKFYAPLLRWSIRSLEFPQLSLFSSSRKSTEFSDGWKTRRRNAYFFLLYSSYAAQIGSIGKLGWTFFVYSEAEFWVGLLLNKAWTRGNYKKQESKKKIKHTNDFFFFNTNNIIFTLYFYKGLIQTQQEGCTSQIYIVFYHSCESNMRHETSSN